MSNLLDSQMGATHLHYFLVNRVFEIDHGEMRVYGGDYEYYLSKAKAGKSA